MSCPHVAGVVAAIISAQILHNGTEHDGKCVATTAYLPRRTASLPRRATGVVTADTVEAELFEMSMPGVVSGVPSCSSKYVARRANSLDAG